MTDMKRASGITLIELMVVIVVVAILASIAVPSYRNYMLRTNRTEGRAALLRVQVAQEKFFLQNNTYAGNAILAAAPPAGLGIPATTESGYYTVAVAPGGTGNIATSYQVTVTAAGTQTEDVAACQVLTLNDQGVKTPNEASGCWK